MQNYVFKYSLKLRFFLHQSDGWASEQKKACIWQRERKSVFECFWIDSTKCAAMRWKKYAKVKPSWLVDKLGYSWDLIKNEKWKLAKYEWNWNDAK